MKAGVLCALGAYLLWGLLPIYWKAVETVPAMEILAHRIVWSFVCVALYLAWRGDWAWLRRALSNPRQLLGFALVSALITANWGLYIWAVNADQMVEASLGYFINPLVSVALGVVFLGERLRALQWASVALAGAGVAYLTFTYGAFPWIAVVLAATFGLYGLLKKTSSLKVMEGMALETGWVAAPAAVYLIWIHASGGGALGAGDASVSTLLLLSGAATALPLILFAAGAKGVPLSTLGLLQYLAPTLQFLLGVFVYGEPFGRDRVIGFGIIWLSLAIFTLERALRGQYRKVRPLSGL